MKISMIFSYTGWFSCLQDSNKYKHTKRGTVPPHIFGVSDAAYQAMLGQRGVPARNQCILIRYKILKSEICPIASLGLGYRLLKYFNNFTFLLCSGESGAGKTESTKLLIKQLIELCKGNTQLEQQILQVGTCRHWIYRIICNYMKKLYFRRDVLKKYFLCILPVIIYIVSTLPWSDASRI